MCLCILKASFLFWNSFCDSIGEKKMFLKVIVLYFLVDFWGRCEVFVLWVLGFEIFEYLEMLEDKFEF